MAKKKKKTKNKPGSQGGAPQKQTLNTPFAGLKRALKNTDLTDQDQITELPPREPANQQDDQALFATAMSDVSPLDPQKRARQPLTGQTKEPRLDLAVDEELEVLAQLADLIDGTEDFDLRFSDQYVAGAGEGVGPELRERLAMGHFPIQDYLVLHGLGRDEALHEVGNFLTASVTHGLRHVLVVHGKGSRSPGGVPVLKNTLSKVLGHKKMRKRVLAFCTAQPRDGGEGAIYVLLRKWQG